MSLMPVLSIIFTVEVNCKVLSRCELGELRPPLENQENFSHGFVSEIRDSNPGPPIYQVQVPVTAVAIVMFAVLSDVFCKGYIHAV